MRVFVYKWIFSYNTNTRKEIVMGLIDIHTHILYGVDDGAKTLSDSMGLLDEEREQGVDARYNDTTLWTEVWTSG